MLFVTADQNKNSIFLTQYNIYQIYSNFHYIIRGPHPRLGPDNLVPDISLLTFQIICSQNQYWNVQDLIKLVPDIPIDSEKIDSEDYYLINDLVPDLQILMSGTS